MAQGDLYKSCAVFASKDTILWKVPTNDAAGAPLSVTVYGAARLDLPAEGVVY